MNQLQKQPDADIKMDDWNQEHNHIFDLNYNHTMSYNNETMENKTSSRIDSDKSLDIMMVLSTAISSVGIIANLTVVIIFLNNKKLRCKIPNIFIINQVSHGSF